MAEEAYSLPIRLETRFKEFVELNTIYQDTKPEGSSVGTFLTIHGAPGSYKDFKYITPKLVEAGVRVIGVNMPGLGLTPGDPRLQYDNHERNQLVQQIIDELDLKNVIFCGHSRGTENALIMTAMNPERATGMVLVNPTGFYRHKGINPEWVLKILAALGKVNSIKGGYELLLHEFYTKGLKFKVKTGAECAVCIQYMNQCALEEQRKFVDELNKNDKIKVVLATSGKDHLIEDYISKDFIQSFKDHKLVEVGSPRGDEEISKMMKKNFDEGNTRQGFFFAQESHFLNKFRADFVVDSVLEIFQRSKI